MSNNYKCGLQLVHIEFYIVCGLHVNYPEKEELVIL